MKYKTYKKEDGFSYALGAFPVYELIESDTYEKIEVFISKAYKEKDSLIEKLEEKNIPYTIDDKQIERISSKGNVYVAGVFSKKEMKIEDKNHIVLDNPQDMGNLGTIIRTMAGFGLKDLAIIGRKIDFFNPKVVRASMGSIFKTRIEYFDSLEAYLEKFSKREIYCFMLGENGQKLLEETDQKEKYSLVFGNEASGLGEKYKSLGHKVIIGQTDEVDSLNITIAAAVSMFWFTKGMI